MSNVVQSGELRELQDMMFTATMQKHPAFIRYPCGAAEGVPIKDQPALLEIGKAEVVQNFSSLSDSLSPSDGERARVRGSRKVALFGLGNMNSLARQAATRLASEGFDVAVINPRFTKPIDPGTHEFFGRGADVVVTLEDHALAGGYGSAVLELFSEKGITTPLVRIGWPDQFIEHASSQDELRRRYGLTVENTVAKVKAQFAEAPASSKLIAMA